MYILIFPKFLLKHTFSVAWLNTQFFYKVVYVNGQVENAETETEVQKWKYGNGNTEWEEKPPIGLQLSLVDKVDCL